MITFKDLADQRYIDQLSKDFKKLLTTAGPTRCVAKISDRDPRIDRASQFPIYETVYKIVDQIKREDKVPITVKQHNGNLVVVGGLDETASSEEIKNIPVTLAAHLDEITYMVTGKSDRDGSKIIIPLCYAPYTVEKNKVKIWGFRERKFGEVGSGEISPKLEHKLYLLHTSTDALPGDLVIQDYHDFEASCTIDSVIRSKALDDRVGVIAQIYVIKELAKVGHKAKAILAGDEEGVKDDVAWARLVRPTFRKYAQEEGVIIICDGFDGLNLGVREVKGDKKTVVLEGEFKAEWGKHLSAALITSYVGEGKGAGDPGVFSILRDKVCDIARKSGFDARITTDYASRSLDPKIMDDFPLIGFINWSCGEVGFESSICHVNESVKMRQLINIIGTTTVAVEHFTRMM